MIYSIEKVEKLNKKAHLKLIMKLGNAYYNTDTPLVDDETYDNIVDIYNRKYGKLEYVGSDPIQNNKKIELPYPLFSLDKIKNSDTLKESIDKWVKTNKGPYIVSEKLDGVSALYTYDKKSECLMTRGNGIIGVDISKLLEYVNMGNISKANIKSIAVRGELIISKEAFEPLSSTFKNARNLVSGLVNSKTLNTDILPKVDFVVYELIEFKGTSKSNSSLISLNKMSILEELGFNVVRYERYTKPNLKTKTSPLYDLSEKLDEFKEESKYTLDGLVVCDENKAKDRCIDGNPKYAFAFKKTNEVAITKVIEVEWNKSRYGVLKPRVKIEPVSISGVVINYATGFNAKFIYDNNLGKDSEIEITRSGDVIPFIKSVIKSTKADMPSEDINWKWNSTSVDIYVEDKDDEDITTKKLVHFLSTLRIKQVSDKTVEKLVQHKIDTIQKLVRLKETDLNGKIEGIKDRSASRIVQNIQEGIKDVPLERLMDASGCFGFGLGEKKLQLITQKYPNVLDMNDNDIKSKVSSIKGYSDNSALSFYEGLKEFKKFLQKTPEISYTTLSPSYLDSSNRENVDDPLNDITIVFTNFRNDDLKDIIQNRGGRVTEAISKKTDILVMGNGDHTTKMDKAEKLGIKMLSLEDFLRDYKINI